MRARLYALPPPFATPARRGAAALRRALGRMEEGGAIAGAGAARAAGGDAAGGVSGKRGYGRLTAVQAAATALYSALPWP